MTKTIHLLLLTITICTAPATAQNIARIQNATRELESLSGSALNNIHTGNMDAAVLDYKNIMSVIESTKTDTLSTRLPFYVNDNIHEPIIKHLAHQHLDKAIMACDFYLDLLSYKIHKWANDGLIKTYAEQQTGLYFLYTKLARWMSEEGMNDAAGQYHKKAIEIFEKDSIITPEYAYALWDMADFQQIVKNDYLKSLHYHYKCFRVLAELYGIESKEAEEAFEAMSTVYNLSMSGLGFLDDAAKYDAPIHEYVTGKEILNFWRTACTEIKDDFGENALSDIFRESWNRSMIHPKTETFFKNKVDSIRYQMLPTRSFDREMAETYCNEAILNIIYGDNNGYYSSIDNIFSYPMSEDELAVYILKLNSCLDGFGYVDKAMEMLAGGISLFLEQGRRPDLVEYLSSVLAPLANRYQNIDYFTTATISIIPLMFHGHIHYYDIENYLTIIGAALSYSHLNYYYDSAPEISNRLCHAADSLLTSHDEEIASWIKAMIYFRIADFQSDMGNEQLQLDYMNRAIHWQKAFISELYGQQWDKTPDSPMWPVFAFEELSRMYGRIHDYENSKIILDKCLEYYMKNDPDNVNLNGVYSELAWIASKTGNSSDFAKYAPEWFKSEMNAYISKSFSMLKKDRENYYYATALPLIHEIITYASLSGSGLTDISYNSALAMKGFLLEQDKLIRHNVSHCSDSALVNSYERYSEAITSGSPDVDKYEYDFMYQYFLHPELRENHKIPNWKDIANALDKDEIAIEFTAGGNADTEVYAALMVKKGWEKPEIVKLADKGTIDKFITSDPKIYEHENPAYSIIWGKIEPFLKGVRTIYFSPYRALCQINIEAMQNEEGIPINMEYEMHRLSSTLLICDEDMNDHVTYDAALLFGGLFYDTDTTYMIEQDKIYDRGSRNSDFTEFALQTRKGWNSLPWTKVEVDNIKQLLDGKIKVEMYQGNDGTESAFKSYNGKSLPIIHLATHGFYLSQKEARYEQMFMTGNASPDYIEPMKRSGLILSGGQHAWLGERIPQEIEDGVLTAEEIAGMDLSGTDLLVLSACQTGLGEVNGEGVYGLQRGFKLAGVNTIIMSLWQVDDQATYLFMQTFYDSLVKGKNKRESFDTAQNKLRKSKKYSYPYYWAAFIMLD